MVFLPDFPEAHDRQVAISAADRKPEVNAWHGQNPIFNIVDWRKERGNGQVTQEAPSGWAIETY